MKIIVTCYKCEIEFKMTTSLYDDLLKSHDTFYCPNGHGQAFGKKKIKYLERSVRRDLRNIQMNSNEHEIG